MTPLRLALVQTNATVGDVAGNAARVRARLDEAQAAGAQLAAFPEQTLLGYPAKDLLLRREIVEQNVAALHELARGMRQIAALVGFAQPNAQPTGRPVFNAVALLADGGIRGVWRKRLLPTYDVFDEARYFEPAGPQAVVEWRGVRLGVTICEDMMSEELLGRALYSSDPVAEAAAQRADLLINLSASPYHVDKHAWRMARVADCARRCEIPAAYVNQVGGNDELLFDGGSFVCDAAGRRIAHASCFREDMLIVEVPGGPQRLEPPPEGAQGLHAALVMGLRDYASKCGFRTAVLGLSGGIDSAVVAALATEALGAANVQGVAMPSRFSSPHSVSDARLLAENLGIRFSIVPIDPVHSQFEVVLRPEFAGRAPDVTEENLQARARGVLLMALSNKFGSLLLSTGNKSELACGYCTLYGDMCGGLAVISDVPKTMVYALARQINAAAGRCLIPQGSLTKPPSAELRPGQTDQDTLPPYEVLDEILERYEERLQSAEEIIAAGLDAATVRRVIRMINQSEYKRQQAAPGLKVTSRAFGFGRRMPIAARIEA